MGSVKMDIVQQLLARLMLARAKLVADDGYNREVRRQIDAAIDEAEKWLAQ